jgi:hypothetical protein
VIYKPCLNAKEFWIISCCWTHWNFWDLQPLFNYSKIIRYFSWWEPLEQMRFTNPVQPLEVARLFPDVGTIGARAIYTPCSTTRRFSNISRGVTHWNNWNRCDLQTLFNRSRILNYFLLLEPLEQMRLTNPVTIPVTNGLISSCSKSKTNTHTRTRKHTRTQKCFSSS